MSFDWNELVSMSERIIITDKTEASFRSSVSRAYYAAFHHAKDFLSFWQIPEFPDQSVHQSTVTRLFSMGKSEIAQIGRSLDRLRIKRVRADYESNIIINENEAKSSLDSAKKIINGLGSIKP